MQLSHHEAQLHRSHHSRRRCNGRSFRQHEGRLQHPCRPERRTQVLAQQQPRWPPGRRRRPRPSRVLLGRDGTILRWKLPQRL